MKSILILIFVLDIPLFVLEDTDARCIKRALRFLGGCVWTFWTIGTGLDCGNVSATPKRSSVTSGFAERNGLFVLQLC